MENFVSSNYTGLSIENLTESKQPLNLIDALLLWMNRRKDALLPGQDREL